LAEGAHDDGTGVVQAIEVIRIFQALGIKPKRTIRAVAFMNEENGGKGGKAYLEAAKKNNEKHYAALESDGGGFSPTGFSMTTSKEVREKIIKEWKPLLEEYGVWNFKGQGGGADIGHLKELKTALFGLEVDGQKYFNYHHTANDVFENVNKRELELGAASMAMFIWLLSEKGL
jgi:carboxypeptidase Q